MSASVTSFKIKMMNAKTGKHCIINEFTRERLAARGGQRLNSPDVLDKLGEFFFRHGPPEHVRSLKGLDVVGTALREWLARLETKTLYIELGSTWAEAEKALGELFLADGVL